MTKQGQREEGGLGLHFLKVRLTCLNQSDFDEKLFNLVNYLTHFSLVIDTDIGQTDPK